jgi:hypothetical protein
VLPLPIREDADRPTDDVAISEVDLADLEIFKINHRAGDFSGNTTTTT